MSESEPTTSSSTDPTTASTGVIPRDWWDPAWHHRRRLIVDNPTETTLSDTPLALRLSSDRIDYTNTSPGGADLRLLPAVGGEPLPLEIESWEVGEESWVWARLPHLPPGRNDYWLYWDNPDAPPPGEADVWSPSYSAVYHLNDPLSDEARLIRDAEGTHNGHAYATMDPSNAGPGAVGPALRFTGADPNDAKVGDFIVSDSAPLNTDGWAGLTLEAWVRHGVPGEHRILCKSPSTAPKQHVFAIGTHDDDGADDPTSVYLRLGIDDADALEFNTAPGLISSGPDAPWLHIAATWDGLTVRIFADGLEVPIHVAYTDTPRTFGVDYSGASLRDDPIRMTIANVNDKLAAAADARFWVGELDELRLSRTAHSPDWIRFQVMSMRDETVEFAELEHFEP